MDTNKWKWFIIRELFDKPYKGLAYNAQDLSICTYNNTKAIRYVTRTENNNGLKGFVVNEDLYEIEEGNAITIGDTTATINYQSKRFICGDHIVILRSKVLNKNRGLFFTTLLSKEKFRYNYGRAFIKDLIYNTKIKLPINEEGKPDWLKIDTYIQETIIPKLPTKVKSVWEKSFNTKSLSNNKLKIHTENWQWFNLGNIFTKLEKCKCSNATELLEDGNEIAYIGAKKSENGIMKYVLRNEDLVSKGNCIVFIGDGQGSVGYCTYQPYDFIGSTTLIAGYNPNLNVYNAHFLISVLDQERYRYSFGRKYKKEIIKASKIKLPVDQFGNPDWQWMEDYIKGLPYSGCL